MIEIITIPGCGRCEALKAALAAQGRAYPEIDAATVDGRAEADYRDVDEFPAVFIDGVRLGNPEDILNGGPPPGPDAVAPA